MNRIMLPLLTLGLSLAPVLCWAAEPKADEAKAIAEIEKLGGKGKELYYRKLVEGLVSPNKPAKCDVDDSRPTYPPNYDKEAQARIEKHQQILSDHCDVALPFLIEGCTDSRYSLTWQSDSYCGNACVGEVCLGIVTSYLEIYREYMPSLVEKIRCRAYNYVPRIHGAIGNEVSEEKKKEIEEWWRARKGKTLLQLQLEAIDWAIEKRKEERKHALGGKHDWEVQAVLEATKEIKRLVAVRDKIKHDGKCLPPGGITEPVGGSKRKKSDK